jgi:2-polyprenyl-3-methyl-5-hydroxy-6-metoxy-1,4-benzoquinol methylase
MSDHFNEKAVTWDADDMVRKLSSATGSSILQHVPLDAEMLVMDFGAGTGLISSKVVTACQDILDQPVATRFDPIMSAMAMHHVKDTDRLIQVFAEHLKVKKTWFIPTCGVMFYK